MGANPRRLSTWEPLLDLLRRWLNSWGNKYVNLGGRIVLINSVLNSISIFLFVFLVVVGKGVEENCENSKRISLGSSHGSA